MRIKDFFEEPTETGNPWDSSEPVLNAGLITQLAQGTAHDPNPLETALELTRLVRAEYESYGTEKSHLRTDEDEARRSEEHTSELQSRFDLVCRLLLATK